MNQGLSELERSKMQDNINRGYDLFVKRCAEGRNKTITEIDSIGQGRVWTGEDALEIGLVDQLGGMNEAFAEAAKLAKLDKYQILVTGIKGKNKSVNLSKVKTDLEQDILKSTLGEFYNLFKELNTIDSKDRIQAKLMFDIDE